MGKYILRLDDASDYMDVEKWERMAILLDQYGIKPIFGIIPQNKDAVMTSKFKRNPDFWDWVQHRVRKGWIPAMHGYEHRYITKEGGINPVNNKSEFAGLSYEEQCKKIKEGYAVLTNHGVVVEIFFAPAHTFDENTLMALRDITSIRIISDTIAYDVYKEGEFWFIPQQSGRVWQLPFSLVTFCYHPNSMSDVQFEQLKRFLIKHWNDFVQFDKSLLKPRKWNCIDLFLQKMYFLFHRLRCRNRGII